jgi:hypothetical protein
VSNGALPLSVRAREGITYEDRSQMWVRFGGDDRVKPQEYSEYFEDFTTKERLKVACRWDARTRVIPSRSLSIVLTKPMFEDDLLADVSARHDNSENRNLPDHTGSGLLQLNAADLSTQCPLVDSSAG